MAEGGRLNATTWFDRTNYFETVPKGAFELALWMEADRHGYLLDAVTQENLDNQRDVVKEEKRQRYDNVPYGNALIDIVRRGLPRGPPLPPPDDRLDGRPRRRQPGGRARVLPARTTAPTTPCSPSSATSTPEEGFAAAERYFGPLPASAEPPAPRGRRAGAAGRARCATSASRTCPNDRLHLAFRLPVDDDAGLLRRLAGDRRPRRPGDLPARTSAWSAASRSPTACRPTPWGSSTGCRWASSASTWPPGASADEVEAADLRGARAVRRGGPDRRRDGVRRSPRPSARGSPRWPARRSAPTPSATTRCCTATPAGSTRSSTGSAHGDGGRHPAGRRRWLAPRRGPSSPTCEPSTKEPPHDPAPDRGRRQRHRPAAAGGRRRRDRRGAASPGGRAAAVDLPRRRPCPAGQRAGGRQLRRPGAVRHLGAPGRAHAAGARAARA